MISLRASLAVVVSSFALCAGLASAQQPDLEKLKSSTPAQRAAIQTEYLTEKVPLTPEQVPKVKAIVLASAEKADPILKGEDGPLVKMRALRLLDESKDIELKGVLTPEQFVEYLGLKDKLRQHLEAKLAGGGA